MNKFPLVQLDLSEGGLSSVRKDAKKHTFFKDRTAKRGEGGNPLNP